MENTPTMDRELGEILSTDEGDIDNLLSVINGIGKPIKLRIAALDRYVEIKNNKAYDFLNEKTSPQNMDMNEDELMTERQMMWLRKFTYKQENVPTQSEKTPETVRTRGSVKTLGSKSQKYISEEEWSRRAMIHPSVRVQRLAKFGR